MESQPRTDRNGFTLVELMIVIAIIAILSLVSVPVMTGMIPRYRVDGATTVLLNAVQEARSRAVAKNLPVTLEFHLTSTPQAVYVYEAGTEKSRITFNDDTAQHKAVKLSRNGVSAALPGSVTGNTADAAYFTGGGSTASAVFLPNGLMQGSGEFFLVYAPDDGTDTKDRTRGIQLFSAGMVKKWRYDGAAWKAY